jgi:hypothetical protein
MAESEEPPFSKEKQGFFILPSIVNQKAVHPKSRPSSLDPPSPKVLLTFTITFTLKIWWLLFGVHLRFLEKGEGL